LKQTFLGKHVAKIEINKYLLISNFVKVVYQLLWVLLGTSIFMACEKKEIVFQGPYHVRFSEPSASARESFAEPIRIAVHLVGPHRNEPITVRYTVSGTARRGIDYQIEGEEGTVVIPPNQSFGYIILRLINNANNILESQDLTFNITSVTPTDLQIGFSKEGIIGRSTTFTILDDCILSGTYTGIREGVRGAAPLSGVNVTSSDCREYILSNWNIGFSILPSIPFSLSFIDNYDNTLTVPAQVNTLMDFDEFRNIDNPLVLANDTLRGIGSVNPLNGQLTFNLEVAVKTRQKKDSTIFYPVSFIPKR
jgi:hypothetical protein